MTHNAWRLVFVVIALVALPIIQVNALDEIRIRSKTEAQLRELALLGKDQPQHPQFSIYDHIGEIPPSMDIQNLPQVNAEEIQVVYDKYTNRGLILRHEFWLKVGLLAGVCKDVPCHTSFHSLSSVLGWENLMIVSDRVQWMQEGWSIPQFFQAAQGYGLLNPSLASSRMAVYDLSNDCTDHDWYSLANVVIREMNCPALRAKYNHIVWVPSGFEDQLNTPPKDLTPSLPPPSARSFQFFVPYGMKGKYHFSVDILPDSVPSNWYVADKILDMNHWKTVLGMRDAVYTLCPLTTIHDPCIYQALTHGSIPIAVVPANVKRELNELLGPVPFPVLALARNIPEQLQRIADVPAAEAVLIQQNILRWWPWKISTWQTSLFQNWFRIK